MSKPNDIKQRLVDFFWVYYDEKTSKNVDRHPEVAVPMLREAIKRGLSSDARLRAYARALSDAVSLQGLVPDTPKRRAKG